MYKSILVATDGSETAAGAVKVATELAKAFGATLHVGNVYRSGELKSPSMTLGLTEGVDRGAVATTQADSVASHARTLGVQSETHVMRGDVADSIIAIAKENNVELIVVGNKGMRGLKRALGSVPNDVAHAAHCDVLIVNTT